MASRQINPTANGTSTARFDDGFLSGASGVGVHYYHLDHLGSTRLLTDKSGNQTWSAAYLPFGQEWNPQATTNHYKFTGYERDAESGNDYAVARQYGSRLGRFLQPDPAGTSATCPFNPQTQNRYAYVTDDPVNRTDPTGLCGDGDNSDCGGIGISIPVLPTGGGEQPKVPTPHPVFDFTWNIGPKTVTCFCKSVSRVPEGRFQICHFGCECSNQAFVPHQEYPLAQLIPACGPITKCPDFIEDSETAYQIGPIGIPLSKGVTSCKP